MRLHSSSAIAGLAIGLLIGVGSTIAASRLGSAIFSDIPQGAYYDASVGKFYDLGIIKGNPDGRYRPGDPVSRAEIAVLLDRLRAEIRGEPVDSGVSASSRRSRSTSSSSSAEPSSSSLSSSSSSSSSSQAMTTAGAFRFTQGAYTANENTATATLTISRAGGSRGQVTVDYALTAGTASAGSDFTLTTGTVNFADKETSKTFTIAVLDDSSAEGNETVNVALKNPSGGAILMNPSTAVLTIVDNETSATSSAGSVGSLSSAPAAGYLDLSASQYSVSENGATLTITVNRAGGSAGAVNVNYATSNGTGKSGSEYTATSGTLSFAAGETSKTFTVAVANDTAIDGSMTFNITLTTPTGGAVLRLATATVTILDDESVTFGTGSLKFSKSVFTATESSGEGVITVLRTGGSHGTVGINYSTSPGSASPGADYVFTSGTLTFAPGEAAKVFRIPLYKDSASDSGETINLDISNPTGGAVIITPTIATLEIYE